MKMVVYQCNDAEREATFTVEKTVMDYLDFINGCPACGSLDVKEISETDVEWEAKAE